MEHLVIRQGGILSQLYRAAAARMRDDQVAEGIAYDDLLAILAGDPDWYRGEQKLGIRKLRSEKP
jgi:hypothetical protein